MGPVRRLNLGWIVTVVLFSMLYNGYRVDECKTTSSEMCSCAMSWQLAMDQGTLEFQMAIRC